VIEFLRESGSEWGDFRLWITALAAGALGLSSASGLDWAALILTLFTIAWLLTGLAYATGEPAARWLLPPALLIYAGWLGRYLGVLRNENHGLAWVLLALLVTFASDTGAYAAGRLLGRHALAPKLSPSKTIEGVIGGVIAAAIVALLLGRLLSIGRSPILLLVLGLAVSVAAQLGDLGESALKRRLGIKDAGFLIPGHGGLLDRLDSLLVAGAVVYYALKWMSL
jgi:phosphatidate cytidylyltransferase